jgi:hypothetical protein
MIKVVKKLVVAGLGNSDILEADLPAAEVKDIDVSTLADTEVQHQAHPLKDNPAREFLIGFAGTLASVGAAATVSYTVTDSADGSVSVSSVAGYIASAEAVKLTVDGERRLLQKVKVQPYGLAQTTTTTTTTTTTGG